MVEEQFGPTVPILPYDDEEQVIQLHNESIYGLTSSVWGKEEDAIALARQLEAGTTMINTAAVQGLDVRFPLVASSNPVLAVNTVRRESARIQKSM